MSNLNLLKSACLITVILSSCQKDALIPGRETGILHIEIGLSMRISEESSELKSVPRTEDFRVTVYRTDGTEAMAFEDVLVMPDTIELEAGDYYVEAHSENNLPAAFENPYYSGVSDVFTISSNSQQSVQVNCELANTIVSVIYSDNVINNFSDCSATVSSDLGFLVYSKYETRKGYFQSLPLEIMVELNPMNPDGSGAGKTLEGGIPDPLPNRHYEIFIDALPDKGRATFQILMDSSEIQVEPVKITDQPDTYQTGETAYGEILITEIMYDPLAIPDTEGEWFEIYNNSDRSINLQNLVLERDGTYRHIITDSIDLPPASFLVFERTELATDASHSYIYGSDILLTNAGAVLSLRNKNTQANPGTLIFSVNYGGVHFPSGDGASISLNPDMMNATDAVAGTSWCISTSVYSTGDLGTPGAVNDSCR